MSTIFQTTITQIGGCARDALLGQHADHLPRRRSGRY
ncbi:Uncharacterised protein [Serratia fonticola]|uniref:Uncharacterized protein n=1 Tax=Serratia fonticola TaxID=47917 RepID=A0A4U9WIH7_SERFO|nr:Uncharacterised protein [Serratia fonticola]